MTTQPSRRRTFRYRYRLVAAMLLVSLPLLIVLAIFLTNSASTSLTSTAQGKGLSVARAVTLRLEDWMSERRESLTVLAAAAANHLNTGETRSALAKVDSTYGDFSQSMPSTTSSTAPRTSARWPTTPPFSPPAR